MRNIAPDNCDVVVEDYGSGCMIQSGIPHNKYERDIGFSTGKIIMEHLRQISIRFKEGQTTSTEPVAQERVTTEKIAKDVALFDTSVYSANNGMHPTVRFVTQAPGLANGSGGGVTILDESLQIEGPLFRQLLAKKASLIVSGIERYMRSLGTHRIWGSVHLLGCSERYVSEVVIQTLRQRGMIVYYNEA